MILVDVQVPALDKVFDFELDEEVKIKSLLDEIPELIAKKQKKQMHSGEKMYLFALERELLLREELTLKEQGIGNGERLILF